MTNKYLRFSIVIMRIIATLNILWVFCSFAKAQSAREVDSLTTWISDHLYGEEHQEALARLRSLQRDSLASRQPFFLHVLGNYYYGSGQYDSALVSYLAALQQAQIKCDSNRIPALQNNMGITLTELGRTNEAITYLTQTLHLRKQKGDTARILSGLGNLAEAYQVLGNTEKAKAIIAEGLALAPPSEKYANRLKHLYYLAFFESYREENLKEARSSISTLQKLNQWQYDEATKGEVHLAMGRIMRKAGKLDSARYYLKQASELFQALKYQGAAAATLLELGNIDLEQGELSQAHRYYRQAERLTAAPDMMMDVYAGLSQIYKAQGNYREALKMQEGIAKLEDSIRGVDMQKAVYELETKYQLREKELEIEALENQSRIAKLESAQMALESKRLRTYLWLVGGTALVSFILMLSLWQTAKLKRDKESLTEKLRTERLENEKNALAINLFRSKINPHFFFNTLNSIQSFILGNNPLESSRYLSQFAQLMRATLELNERNFITVKQEAELLDTYLHLEKLRFEDRFSYQMNLAKETEQALIPTMCLQPFAENAIVHGFAMISYPGEIVIETWASEGRLHLELADNGKGYKPNSHSPKKPGKSMALKLLRQRFELLSEEQGELFSFKITARGDRSKGDRGTMVHISIPLKY